MVDRVALPLGQMHGGKDARLVVENVDERALAGDVLGKGDARLWAEKEE